MPDTTPHCPGPCRPLVLASTSPRRRDLLRGLGLRFELDAAEIDETLPPGANIDEAVVDLALQKARQVAPRHPESLIVTADTLVELEGRIFSKPAGADEARTMLREMSARCHRVASGLVLLDAASGRASTRLVETMVTFREMTGAEIDAYVATGEPFDKAGAYGIQGLGAVFVQRIEGDYYNVAGLPIEALNQLLTEAGCCIICRHLLDRA